jgi:hypothetical protein
MGVIMKYAAEMGSDGMIYIPNFIKIIMGIQAILRLSLPRPSWRLQCWNYCWEGFMKYAVEMTPNGMTHKCQVS